MTRINRFENMFPKPLKVSGFSTVQDYAKLKLFSQPDFITKCQQPTNAFPQNKRMTTTSVGMRVAADKMEWGGVG